MTKRTLLSIIILLIVNFATSAQEAFFPPTKISLENLDAFEANKNWKIARDVFYDFKGEAKPKISGGVGILVNEITEKDKSHLLTKMMHGDIELELDFMMAKNSNAGVYLQGRYEIQMFDSWTVKNPKSTDCAAIYERWDERKPEGRKGYEGHPPAQNVSRAPGLWQHFKIIFRAPRFNAQGEKIENAKFVRVEHNGVVVHENIEVTGPTRAAYFEDEKPLGPLMIQGDHGPVAIRNIQYRLYGDDVVTLSSLARSTFEGRYRSIDAVDNLQDSVVESITLLTYGNTASSNHFAGRIKGNIQIPKTGKYFFKLNLKWIPSDTNADDPNGGGELRIDDKPIASLDGRKGGTATITVDLDAGLHSFSLVYYKVYPLWYAQGNDIEVGVESLEMPYRVLNSVPRSGEAVGAIVLKVKDQPVMQRCFVQYEGKKKTHVIAVGFPGKLNYAYDLSAGSFLQCWRGNFVETTLMWHERGEQQIAVPLGSVLQRDDRPTITILKDKSQTWPDSNATYSFKRYRIEDGNPVIEYALGETAVQEKIESVDAGKKLLHRIALTNASGNVWCRVGSGAQITKLSNGVYEVNGKQYYIMIDDQVQPLIRDVAQGQEILIPINIENKTGAVQYSIVW